MSIKRGLRVKVARKAWAPTWPAFWTPAMDKAIGLEGVVTRADMWGIHISFDNAEFESLDLFAFPGEAVEILGYAFPTLDESLSAAKVSSDAELKALHILRRDLEQRLALYDPKYTAMAAITHDFLKQLDKLFPAGKIIA